MARISKGQLQKLQKKYATDEAIGTLFGISRQAVYQLRRRYGIVPVEGKHRTRDGEIVKGFRDGISATALAKKFRLSAAHVYRIINAGVKLMERR